MDIEVTTITAERKELYPQLKWSYENQYVPCFPLSKDRESLDEIKANIEGAKKGLRTVVQLVGYNITHPYKHDIRGMCVAYYYEPQNSSLLSNIASDLDEKRHVKGIGKVMIHNRITMLESFAKARGMQLAGVGLECNDDTKISAAEDSMAPKSRLEMFNHLGARRAPVPYAESLVLLTYPLLDAKTGLYTYPGAKGTELIIRGVNREGRTDEDTNTKPRFQEERFNRIIDACREWGRNPAAYPDACPPPSATPPNYMRNMPKFRIV